MILEYKNLEEKEGIIITIDDEGNEVETTGMVLVDPEHLIEIEEGLTLSNPKMELMNVNYDLKTNQFELTVDFWETKYRHAIRYEIFNDKPGSLNLEYLLEFVANHPILSQFTEVV